MGARDAGSSRCHSRLRQRLSSLKPLLAAAKDSTNLHDSYHIAGDIRERIDYAKLTRMARCVYRTGWYVANAPKRPAVDAGFTLERLATV